VKRYTEGGTDQLDNLDLLRLWQPIDLLLRQLQNTHHRRLLFGREVLDVRSRDTNRLRGRRGSLDGCGWLRVE
jgi:hypothetical protein